MQNDNLIEEARGFAEWWRDNPQNSDVIYAIVRMVDGDAVQRQVTASGLDRLADALEVAEARATEAEAGRVAADNVIRATLEAMDAGPEADPIIRVRQLMDAAQRTYIERANVRLEYERRTKVEAERDAALAVIEKAREAVKWGSRMDANPTRMGGSPDVLNEAMWWQNWHLRADQAWRKNMTDALTPVPADVLRERDAERWDEGAQWAAVELGAIDNERQAWITPTDNPYRQTEEEK